jgi:hypothetical protein
MELRGDLDLAQEPFGAEYRGVLRPQDLDGHLAVVLEVLGAVDSAHRAAADAPLDPVAAGEADL